jgi:hypothetical protein
MGASGVDVQLSEKALSYFPYAVECKNRARIGTVYEAYEQAQTNAEGHQPLVVLKQNGSPVLAVVEIGEFFRILGAHQKNN